MSSCLHRLARCASFLPVVPQNLFSRCCEVCSSDLQDSPKETADTYNATLSPRMCCSSRTASTQMFRSTRFQLFPWIFTSSCIRRRCVAGLSRLMSVCTEACGFAPGEDNTADAVARRAFDASGQFHGCQKALLRNHCKMG